MVAEPAFLSEYTIFALDSSKQPKTQINSVVSPSAALCIPKWGSKHLGSCSSNYSGFVTYLPSERPQCDVANLALNLREQVAESGGCCFLVL